MTDYSIPEFNSREDIINWIDSCNGNPKFKLLILGNALGTLLEEKLCKNENYRIEKTPDLNNGLYYITLFDNGVEKKTTKYNLLDTDKIVDMIWKLYEKSIPKVKVEFKDKKEEILYLDPDIIDASSENIRDRFIIDGLIRNIAEEGQKEPIRVKKKGDRYIVISGHRRTMACQELKKQNANFKIKALLDQDADEVHDGLQGNLHRDNVSPIALGKGILKVIKQVKETNQLGPYKKILSKKKIEFLKAKGTWVDPFGTCKEITDIIEHAYNIPKHTQQSLLNNLKQSPEIQEMIARGDIGSQAGEIVMKFNYKDLPDALRDKITKALNRDKTFKTIDKKAKDARDVNTLYLHMFQFLENNISRIQDFYNKNDLAFVAPETKISVRKRAIIYINNLMKLLEINKDNL